MKQSIFQNYIRRVTEEDRENLPTFSYSRLEEFKNCPYAYYKQEVEGKKEIQDTLPLNLGSICHKVLELKGQMLRDGDPVDYDYLNNILHNGIEEEDKAYHSFIDGIDSLKKKYFEQWYESDNASGMTYEDKMNVFETVVHKSMDTEDIMDNGMWYPIEFEKYFEFVYKDRAVLHGYIDCIHEHRDGRLRTVDYKTSKKTYDKSKLATSLQFGIYALSMLIDFGQLPAESVYDFILLDKKQNALSMGWEKRLEKALDKILDQIDQMMKQGHGEPKPSPLCHWCQLSNTNPTAKQYKNECDYYSLWTPTNKTFEKHREWSVEDMKKPKRKLVF